MSEKLKWVGGGCLVGGGKARERLSCDDEYRSADGRTVVDVYTTPDRHFHHMPRAATKQTLLARRSSDFEVNVRDNPSTGSEMSTGAKVAIGAAVTVGVGAAVYGVWWLSQAARGIASLS